MSEAKRICYKAGYKYQLVELYIAPTGICASSNLAAVTKWVWLGEDGSLSIQAGYAWDGPSGPTQDSPGLMRASLVHDALYQLMRLGLLDKVNREAADKLYQRLCLEDGI